MVFIDTAEGNDFRDIYDVRNGIVVRFPIIDFFRWAVENRHPAVPNWIRIVNGEIVDTRTDKERKKTGSDVFRFKDALEIAKQVAQDVFGIDLDNIPRKFIGDIPEFANVTSDQIKAGIVDEDKTKRVSFEEFIKGLSPHDRQRFFRKDIPPRNTSIPSVQLEEGKAYKFPNSPKIYQYVNGQFVHIPNEEVFRQIYGGLPEEGVNYTTLPGTIEDYIIPHIPQMTSQTSAAGSLDNLINVLQDYIDELRRRGKVINPNVEITPDKVAEFLHQAEKEINPFYANQLKMAREGFLRELGFTREDIEKKEQELERKYRESLRTLGESFAERGFALSGIRQQKERELAELAQGDIEDLRRQAQRTAERAARKFVQRFGFENLPRISLPEAPRVFPSEPTFERSTREIPFYQLSPEVFQGIIGSEEFQRRADVQRRAAELEEAFRKRQALQQQRQLIL